MSYNPNKHYKITYNVNSDFDPHFIQRDPVWQEIERQDRLEVVVNMRSTDWVKDYCKDLWFNGPQQ